MQVPLPPLAASLTESARSVFRTLVTDGPKTRPALGQSLNFSKPTMSAAVAELTQLGLVAPSGLVQGSTGRKAVVYGLGSNAGHVMGVDIGSTQVRAVAQSLDGRVLAEAEEPLSITHEHFGSETADALRVVRRRLNTSLRAEVGPLRCIAIAVPTIVSRNRPDLTHQGDLQALQSMFPTIRGVRQLMENNVNCAAIAELRHGAAQGRSSFAYLQVGVKVGLGIVQNRALYRGFNGAAGEVARLPFPWGPAEAPRRHGLEHYLGSHDLMRRVAQAWPSAMPPRTPKDLFEHANAGSPEARHLVEEHAADIGRLVAAIVGLIDPGLVILGGGVGQNAILLETVQRVAAELAWTVEITSSALGSRGTVLGAAQLAAAEAIDTLIGVGETSAGR